MAGDNSKREVVASDFGADLPFEPRDVAEQDIAAVVKDLRESFAAEVTRDMINRGKVLKAMKKMLHVGEPVLKQALWQDLHKHPVETFMSELSQVRLEVQLMIDCYEDWSKMKGASTSLCNLPGRSYVQAEPYGVVCIVATWNYPLALSLIPVAAALAAGNTVVLRLAADDTVRRYNNVLMNLMDEYLDKRYIRYVYGGVEESKALLQEKFDLIFATGSPNFGKIVMRAAAEHLTPTVLELGGKNPCVVDSSANLDLAARRIAWGAFTNAGQTCIRPDYVLVDEAIGDKFTSLVVSYLLKFFGSDPKATQDYGRFANTRMFERVAGLLEADKEYIKHGGQTDADELYIAPTIMCFNTDVKAFAESAVMSQEVFGPILPILYYPAGRFDITYRFITFREKPLAAYLFSTSGKNKKRFVTATSSGSLVFNDTMVQYANPHVPFGGVGSSGFGSYRGKYGFDAFSHHKAVMYKYSIFDIPQRYPPYLKGGESMLGLILRPMSKTTWELIGVVIVQILMMIGIIFASNYYRANVHPTE